MTDIRDALLTFFANVDFEYDPDGEYLPDGTTRDCSRYIITAKPFEMEELIEAAGIDRKFYENAFEAINRTLEEESARDARAVKEAIETLEPFERETEEDRRQREDHEEK